MSRVQSGMRRPSRPGSTIACRLCWCSYCYSLGLALVPPHIQTHHSRHVASDEASSRQRQRPPRIMPPNQYLRLCEQMVSLRRRLDEPQQARIVHCEQDSVRQDERAEAECLTGTAGPYHFAVQAQTNEL